MRYIEACLRIRPLVFFDGMVVMRPIQYCSVLKESRKKRRRARHTRMTHGKHNLRRPR